MAEFDDEIILLVTEFLDGQIDAGRSRRLSELLSTHAKARTYYLEMIALHTGLKAMLKSNTKLPDMLSKLDDPNQIPAKNN